MDALIQDLRYALRRLLKSPKFTAVAILTLAVGIGANTAVFSFANSLFLQPLPLPESERLVRFYRVTDGYEFDTFSYPNYLDARERNLALTDLAAHRGVVVSSSDGDRESQLSVELVSGNYFSVFDVGAALGRTLTPADDMTLGAHPVVVISHGMWKSRFGSDPAVVGKGLTLNRRLFTVVGVMPEDFKGSYPAFATHLWAPLMMHEQIRPTGADINRRGWGWLNGTGRLRPGVTLDEARADMRRVARLLEQDFPRINQGWGFTLFPAGVLPEQLRSGAAGLLGVFLLVVCLVLLVVCANIACVQLVRAVTGRREIAVRQSLGAGRSRLIRQWITESLVLSLLGGTVGIVVALWAQEMLLQLLRPIGFLANFAPGLLLDWKVLGFTFVLATLTGVLFGVVPATRAGRIDVATSLKEESGSSTGGLRRSRMFATFIVSQVAVSLMLLVTAGLLLRTLRQASSFDPGFEGERILLANLNLAPYGYDEVSGREFYRELSARLSATPGLVSVSFAQVVPLGGEVDRLRIRVPGHEPSPEDPTIPIDFNVVGPGYFSVMGIPILRGRDFDERDANEAAQPVVVINETMARRFWPGEDPIGKLIQSGADGPFAQIIGVARDIKYYSLAEEPRPYFYLSSAQYYTGSSALHIRSAGDPRALAGAVRRQVAAVDPAVALQAITTFPELRRAPLFPQRALGSLTTIFGTVTLFLTALGLYGLVSYSVTQRTREIGLRVALGARPSGITGMVIKQGMALTAIGVGAGLAGSFATTRFLADLLFGVAPNDPFTFAAISTVMAGIALLACYLPARRAVKIDPMVALRFD